MPPYAEVAVWRCGSRRRRSRPGRPGPGSNGGGQPRCSELAVTTALTLRAAFRLALRQTEGLIGSIISLPGLDLPVPDHTTLSRLAEALEVPQFQSGTCPVHLDGANPARQTPSSHRGAWAHWLSEGLGLSLACPGRGGYRALQAGDWRWTAFAYRQAPRSRTGHRRPRAQQHARTRTVRVCPYHVNSNRHGAYCARKAIHATQSGGVITATQIDRREKSSVDLLPLLH